MRKLFSLCGVIVLALLFVCACGNTEQNADVSELEGEWKVGGVYVKGYLIDVNDVEDIAGIYDGYRLTINEDGSFVYLMKILEFM